MVKHEKRALALAELKMGATIAEVRDKLDVPYSTILKWRRDEAKHQETADIADLDPTVVDVVVRESKKKIENMPESEKLAKEFDKVATAVDGMKLLEAGFHDTMMNMLKWANKRITDDMKVSEWSSLVTGVSTLHRAAFGKDGGTVINMQQNNVGSSSEVSKFKQGFRN